VVEASVVSGDGWKSVESVLGDLTNRTSFYGWKKQCEAANGDASGLRFETGRSPIIPKHVKVKLAKALVNANEIGDELNTQEVKAFLEAEPSVAMNLSRGRMKSVALSMRDDFGISIQKANKRTAAQVKENQDIRNPINHAAGYLCLVRLHPDQPEEIDPRLRFSFDFSGEGVMIVTKNDLLVWHPKHSNIRASRKSRATELKTNMKFATATNCTGQGMEQLYVFKNTGVPEGKVSHVTIPGLSPDGRLVHVLFSSEALGCVAVVSYVYEKVLLPWMDEVRLMVTGGQVAQQCLTQDGDPVQNGVLKSLIPKLLANNTRVSFSQLYIDTANFFFFFFFFSLVELGVYHESNLFPPPYIFC
jgi:hypothetical protein